MDSFIFASNNENKVKEIRELLQNRYQILSLKEAGIDIDIPEPYHTLEENATEKSMAIYKITGKNCFSEDTGLEVASLNGEPGVKSARYAGDENNTAKNMAKLLAALAPDMDRKARFRTVISLIIDGREYQFEGICKGEITEAASGNDGFGYDPIFIPEGATKTFGEMDMAEKNKYSHRKKAIALLTEFLKNYHGKA